MTIVTGFLGSDSVVLAADTEETVGPHLKVSVSKLQPIVKDKWHAVIGGGGNAHLINRFIEEMNGIDGDITRAELIKSEIEDALEKVFKAHVYAAPADMQGELEFSVIIGLWSEANGLALLETSGTSAIYSPDDHSCIGLGKSHARKMADQWFTRGLSKENLVLMANYILRQTKKYEPYCGGDTQMLSLGAHGAVQSHAPEESKDDEGYSELFDMFIRVPFAVCAKDDATEQQFEYCKNLMKLISDLRKTQKLNRVMSEVQKAELIRRILLGPDKPPEIKS